MSLAKYPPTKDLDEKTVDNLKRDYEEILYAISDEELGYEFADSIGDEYDEFNWIIYHQGKAEIIRKLVAEYEYRLYEIKEKDPKPTEYLATLGIMIQARNQNEAMNVAYKISNYLTEQDAEKPEEFSKVRVINTEEY
jgi:vacuolar-type H+-ATPase subunit I/STV1